MSRIPTYQQEGWRPAGPGGCRCPKCGQTVTTNALGRDSHRKGCAGWEAFRVDLSARKKEIKDKRGA